MKGRLFRAAAAVMLPFAKVTTAVVEEPMKAAVIGVTVVTVVAAPGCNWIFKSNSTFRADPSPTAIDVTLRQAPTWQIVWAHTTINGWSVAKTQAMLLDVKLEGGCFCWGPVQIKGIGLTQWRDALIHDINELIDAISFVINYVGGGAYAIQNDSNARYRVDCVRLSVTYTNSTGWHVVNHPEDRTCEQGELMGVAGGSSGSW